MLDLKQLIEQEENQLKQLVEKYNQINKQVQVIANEIVGSNAIIEKYKELLLKESKDKK